MKGVTQALPAGGGKLVEDPDATLTQTTTSRLARVGEQMLERRH